MVGDERLEVYIHIINYLKSFSLYTAIVSFVYQACDSLVKLVFGERADN